MDLVDLSTVAGSSGNFERFIDQLCQRLGVEYGSYATINPVTGAVQGYATYRQDWKRHYMDRKMHLVDPTIHRAALSISPVDWSRFERDSQFNAVFRSGLLWPPLAHPLLSGREREVLQWVAAGKSQQDVGDILGISTRTVEVHLRSAREKIGALTTVQAVGRAIGLNIIYPL